MKPTAYVFYHYLPPDDVVSAIHFGELAAGLVRRGWNVVAYPCVWSCRNESVRFPVADSWEGVTIKRLWRPRFPQSSTPGRLLNALWMITRWSLTALDKKPSPHVVIVGTDPILSVITARFWKRFKPKTRIAHWCFDLYPEAAIADGLILEHGILARVFRHWLRPAYQACSLIVDIGPSMRRLLAAYSSDAVVETFVPWALSEPASPLATDLTEREHVFGSTHLALLYSGSFGRAHSYEEILDLSDLLAQQDIAIAFSVGGNRVTELKSAAANRSSKIRFVPFAPADKLDARLACADVHIVTLRPEWSGAVVPSKFFGALAAGRPVLFSGSSDSSIAHWIRLHNIGWVLDSQNTSCISDALKQYAESPEAQREMKERCFAVYWRYFSREVQIDSWERALRSLIQ
jgi:colanic acid biosynthesis glycosyl transferase WcaI